MRRVLFRKLGLGRGPRNSTTARLTGFSLGFDLVAATLARFPASFLHEPIMFVARGETKTPASRSPPVD
jgi:hypothetical protein